MIVKKEISCKICAINMHTQFDQKAKIRRKIMPNFAKQTEMICYINDASLSLVFHRFLR